MLVAFKGLRGGGKTHSHRCGSARDFRWDIPFICCLYDRWQCAEEREPDGANWEARRQYVYGDRFIDEVLIFDKDTDEDGDFVDAGDYNLYVCQDALYNVVALTETDGDRLERVWYEAYGTPTCRRESDGSEQTTSFYGNPYLFQGRRLDSETDLYYFRNRYMSPTLGRFLQRDPIGYADGMTLYQFVSGRPTSFVDVLGVAKDPWYEWATRELSQAGKDRVHQLITKMNYTKREILQIIESVKQEAPKYLATGAAVARKAAEWATKVAKWGGTKVILTAAGTVYFLLGPLSSEAGAPTIAEAEAERQELIDCRCNHYRKCGWLNKPKLVGQSIWYGISRAECGHKKDQLNAAVEDDSYWVCEEIVPLTWYEKLFGPER